MFEAHYVKTREWSKVPNYYKHHVGARRFDLEHLSQRLSAWSSSHPSSLTTLARAQRILYILFGRGLWCKIWQMETTLLYTHRHIWYIITYRVRASPTSRQIILPRWCGLRSVIFAVDHSRYNITVYTPRALQHYGYIIIIMCIYV